MSEDLLMDLADCGSPEGLLGVLFRHHPDWSSAIPLKELCHKVGIIEFQDLEIDGFEGALMTNPGKTEGFILVKAGTPTPRWRFTAAHELGHFLLPSHKGNRQCTKDDLRESRRDTIYQRQESEANRFAAGLLMPKPSFSRNMDRLGEADVSHIRALADAFETSMEATANRYIELTDEDCAIVFSKDNVIRYVRASKDFPRLAARSGRRLPEGCSTLSAPLLLHTASPWSEMDGSIWLEAHRGKHSSHLLEQSLRQYNGYQITLLSIEASVEHDDEADVNENWAVRFHRR